VETGIKNIWVTSEVVQQQQSVHKNPAIFWQTLKSKQTEFCKNWGFHGSDYEEYSLLGCYAIWLL
jgi:hypothetical protein